MFLECTRVARIPKNSVILLSRVARFRDIENIVEKNKSVLLHTWLELLSRISNAHNECLTSKNICLLAKYQTNHANFDMWPKHENPKNPSRFCIFHAALEIGSTVPTWWFCQHRNAQTSKQSTISISLFYQWCVTKVGKVLTARENPGGKTRVFPGWAILPEMAGLGNKIFSPQFSLWNTLKLHALFLKLNIYF